MLRLVIRSQTPEESVLEAHGWIVGADVALLEREGEQLRHRRGRLVLELGGVRSVDRDGLELLRRWQGEGLSLCGGSRFVRALLAESGLISTSRSPSTGKA